MDLQHFHQRKGYSSFAEQTIVLVYCHMHKRTQELLLLAIFNSPWPLFENRERFLEHFYPNLLSRDSLLSLTVYGQKNAG